MALLNKQFQDILGINPKYSKAINSLPEKSLSAYSTIVNLCAHSILNYDYIQQIPYRKAFGVRRIQDKKFKCDTFTTKTIKYHSEISVAGATMTKLVNLGLLENAGKDKYDDKINCYRIPADLFTTNDLSISFYEKQKKIEDF